MSGPGADMRIDIVVPSIGRPSLAVLLGVLAAQGADGIVVADDRAEPDGPLPVRSDAITIVSSGGRGPAAARNAGWRAGTAPWVAFLDDDVVPSPTWLADLRRDLDAVDADASGHVGAVCGRLHAPRPSGRPPTDTERNVIALERSTWITADMAVRREVLEGIGGFDERFRRAFREDTDLALRIVGNGWRITEGQRTVTHPLRGGGWAVSVRAQRGNADDALMRRLHGHDWRERGHAPPGRLRWHLVTTGAAAVAAVAALARARRVALLSLVASLVAIARFWWTRARLGPRALGEWAQLALSSTLIPFVATWYAVLGWVRARRLIAPRVSR